MFNIRRTIGLLQAMFLHNVLLCDPMYRRALDALIVPADCLGAGELGDRLTFSVFRFPFHAFR